MAGIKAPIIDIMAKVETITVRNNNGEEIPLRTRIWNNQVQRDIEGKGVAYEKPAAFLEVLSGVQWEQMGQGYQNADIGWRIHLVHEFYDAQDGTMDQDLLVFDIRDKIITTLALFTPTGCGPMVKIQEDQDFEHTNIYHYIIDFACNFIDSKGSLWDQEKLIEKLPPTDLEVDIYINSVLSQVINFNVIQPEKAFSAQYTATADGETQAYFPEAKGGSLVMAIIEIKPLQLAQYNWDPVTAFLTLTGVSLDKDQTLFIIYSKPIQ